MTDTENGLPPLKKRAAGRELNCDRPELDEEDDAPELEGGIFKRASVDVLATRRIVKVRRNQGTSLPASNPFAGIRLVQPAATNPSGQQGGGNQKPVVDALREKNDGAVEVREKEKVNEKEPLCAASTEETVGVMHNVNANDPDKATVKVIGNDVEKDGIVNYSDNLKNPTEAVAEDDARTGVGRSDDKSQDEVESNTNSAPLSSFQQLPVLKGEQTPVGFGLSSSGNSPMFPVSKGDGNGVTPPQEVFVETGEENKRVVFNADSVLFEFVGGRWKERGKGEAKVNISKTEGEKARILMRTRGNYRLVLNANLYPGMKLTNMDKKGVAFVCANSVSEARGGLSAFALKLKDVSIMEEFHKTVTVHKGKTTAGAAQKTRRMGQTNKRQCAVRPRLLTK